LKAGGIGHEGKLERWPPSTAGAGVHGLPAVSTHVLERLGRNSEAEADREAARSLTAAMEARSFDSAERASSSQWTAPTVPRTYDYGSQDVVGPGRYILNFLLAGLVGLVVTFALRNHGWLATWISLAIFVAGLIILAAAGPEALGLDFETSSR
jgi:hypothetical protein